MWGGLPVTSLMLLPSMRRVRPVHLGQSVMHPTPLYTHAGECLGAVHNLLQQLRAMHPNDIRAFPLLNESQRLVAQLREGTKNLRAPDKDAWLL